MSARTSLIGLATLAMAVSCGSEPLPPPAAEDPPMHPAWRRARVLITDADEPVVHVYDVEFEAMVEPVALPEPARQLVLADGGEYLLAQGPNSVTPIYVGVSILDHSEGASDSKVPHLHVYKYPPTVVGVDLSGEGSSGGTPAVGAPLVGALGHELAIAATDGAVTTVVRFEDRSLLDPETFVPSSTAYFDMAPASLVPVPGGVVIAEANAISARIDGVDGSAVTTPCPEAFGALASTGGRAVFGCSDGVVLVSADGAAPSLEHYASTRPEAVALHVDRDEVVVADGSTGLVRFDSTGPLPAFDAPAAICDLLYEPGHGEVLLALSSDGALYTLDSVSGEELAVAPLAAPFACDDERRPRLSAIPARAYVLLPAARELVELWVDADLRELTRTALPGSPRTLRTAGFDLETRNLGDLSDVE